MMCVGKIRYATEREALDALRETRRYNGGKSLRWLGKYPCTLCGGWHIGHDRRGMENEKTRKSVPKPATPKAPTPAKLKRQQKHVEKNDARRSRFALRTAGWHIDDLAIAADRARDLADSLAAAKRIADELFAGLRPA